jgi:hypothetical protein
VFSMSKVRTYSAQVCFLPCLWTVLCELLRSTRISRQELPRLPPLETHSGTSGQGRSFLFGCPKELSSTPTHDPDPVVHNSCSSPALYRRRNAEHGFSETRRRVCGTPNNRVLSISGLHPNRRLPNLHLTVREATDV